MILSPSAKPFFPLAVNVSDNASEVNSDCEVPSDASDKLKLLSPIILNQEIDEEQKTIEFKAKPLSGQIHVDSLATLKFMLAKRRSKKPISLPPTLLDGSELLQGEINIINFFPKTNNLITLKEVGVYEYSIVSAHLPTTLFTKGISTNFAIAAIGFNAMKTPVVRGLMRYDNLPLLEDFLKDMKAKGSNSIHLYIAGGYSKSEEIFKEIDRVKKSDMNLSIQGELLNPNAVNLKSVNDVLNGKYGEINPQGSLVNFNRCLDVVKMEITMGITSNGAIFVIKNNLFKEFNIKKLVQLYLFCSPEKKGVESLAIECRKFAKVKEEIIHDLITILKEGSLSHATTKTNLLANVKFFIDYLQRPF